MAQKLPIPVLAGNSYEISSLSLTASKGYSFRFNNLPQGNCRSTIDKLLRVLDRVDFMITLFKPDFKVEKQKATYVKILKRVNRANQFRKDRILADPTTSVSNLIHLNSFLIEPKAKTILQRQIHQKNYSIRAIERSYRIARTIADFDECEWVGTGHLSEAISLRG